jgi:hypothetical protein
MKKLFFGILVFGFLAQFGPSQAIYAGNHPGSQARTQNREALVSAKESCLVSLITSRGHLQNIRNLEELHLQNSRVADLRFQIEGTISALETEDAQLAGLLELEKFPFKEALRVLDVHETNRGQVSTNTVALYNLVADLTRAHQGH